MTQRKREIGDPIEQAATFGTIGGKKEDTQEPGSKDSQELERLSVQAPSGSGVQTSKTERRKQTVYLSPYLVKWLKVYAAQQEREISEIVEEALEAYRLKTQ